MSASLAQVSPVIATALIALSGVLLSTLVSWLISRQSLRSQLKGVRLQLHQASATSLQERRLVTYSELHQLVRSFVRDTQERRSTFETLKTLQSAVTDWDAKHSVLLGAEATGVIYRFERMLRSLVTSGDVPFSKRISDPAARLKLIRRCFEVETALKGDLGIYAIDFGQPGKRFASYGQIVDALEGADDA